MGLAEELERRLERVVEGFFSKAFRSNIQPAEIGRRLLREQEGNKSISLGAVYSPNHYEVRLAPADYERFEGLAAPLAQEFVSLLKENARDRRWKFSGSVDVVFQQDAAVKEGRFTATALHDAALNESDQQETPPVLKLEAGNLSEEWVLDSDVSIGRLSECEIVLSDPNVSRRHAEIHHRDDGWWLVDAGSTNGTFVNEAIVKERRLSSGDRIQIGSTELVFVDPAE